MNPSYFIDATFDLHISFKLTGTNLNQLESQTKLFQQLEKNRNELSDEILNGTKRFLGYFESSEDKGFNSREHLQIVSITNVKIDSFKPTYFFSPTHRTNRLSYEMVGEENDDKFLPDPRHKKEEIVDELDSEGFLKIYYIEGEMYYKNRIDKSFSPLLKL